MAERRYRLPDGTWAAWCTSVRAHWCYLCEGTIEAGAWYRRTRQGLAGAHRYRKACKPCAEVDDVERALLGGDPLDGVRMEQEEVG